MYRGEIWWVDLEPAQGSELRKRRPAVVVNADGIGKLPLIVVIPLTDWNDKYYEYPWMVLVAQDNQNNLTKLSAADSLNIRALDAQRFQSKIGDIRPAVMEDILAAISIVLGMPID